MSRTILGTNYARYSKPKRKPLILMELAFQWRRQEICKIKS